MDDVTRILDAAKAGDRKAAAELLPLIYDELRKLAAARMAAEPTGQTLDATSLVHEAYLRLIGPADDHRWENRSHFFGAAAEAMRRILVDRARRRQTNKHGGDRRRCDLDASAIVAPETDVDLLALDLALQKLAQHDPAKAKLVELRYFAGLTLDQTAEVLGVSPRTLDRDWVYTKAWLRREMGEGA